MTATIDRDITIQHETTKANFASNGRPVSVLYLWKHYRALVLENERLLAQPEPEADAENDELTETLKRMRQVAAHNYPSKTKSNGGNKNGNQGAV